MAAELILVGRATANAEIKDTAKGKMAKFSLAVNRRFDREKSDFITVLLFGNLAEFAEKYVKKGGSFRVSGSVSNDNYTDKDGVSHRDITVTANSIKYANGGSENVISIDGNLTKDAEVRYSTGEKQTAIAHYAIAVNKGKTADGKELTDFFDITSFGRDAEFAEKYFTKGNPVIIRGELQKGSWTDRDGNSHRSVNVVSERIGLGAKRQGGEEAGGNANAEAKPETPSFMDGPDGFMQIPDGVIDELPWN